MTQVFDRVLAAARQLGASDVHLKVGLPPIFRVKGELRGVKDVPALSSEALEGFARAIMNPLQSERFDNTHEADLAYGTPDGVRYRVNVFRQRGLMGLVLRVIPSEVPAFESLRLPEALLRMAEQPRGLVLATGVTGSGKSTTLAVMVDYINRRRAGHIVTVEDPIEYVFRDRRSVVNQRELGLDTMSFSAALRAALRQDPDVILVGEMRDLETIETAMTAAETGHLVLSTLHTLDAMETVNRIVSVFPTHQQEQVRVQLASVLVGVISQRLIPTADGKSRVPACEVLVNTPRIRELMLDQQRSREIRDAIASGRHPYGMFTFDQSLTELVKEGLITYEQALQNATNADEFVLHFQGISEGSKDSLWESGEYPSARTQSETAGLELDLTSRRR
ncbi:MAG: type IV pilus twitching motility protein PilT [Polyangia bacterium]|nr:type IV pilus twitching motility protein PilT [Polyangia bacterium]